MAIFDCHLKSQRGISIPKLFSDSGKTDARNMNWIFFLFCDFMATYEENVF